MSILIDMFRKCTLLFIAFKIVYLINYILINVMNFNTYYSNVSNNKYDLNRIDG